MKIRANQALQHNDPSCHVSCLADITASVHALDTNKGEAFLVLGTNDMTYVQCSGDVKAGFDLEYQEGSVKKHFRATRDFKQDEIIAIFVAYAKGDFSWKDKIAWESIKW